MNMQTPIVMDASVRPYAAAGDAGQRPRRRWIFIGLAIAAALVATWALFGRAKPPVVTAPTTTIPEVTVVVPGQQTVADSVRVTGSIAARRDMPVGVQGEGGLVTAVFVDAGNFVRKGQILASIDRTVQTQQLAQMTAAIRTAKADAALAQAEVDRAARLVSKGFVSKADVDRKTATRDASLARVAVAEAQRGEMVARVARLDVRAPASGLVLTRNVETGQIAGSGGTPLFRIAEDSVLEMRAQVAEQDLARLRPGMPAEIMPAGSAQVFRGRIWLIDPVIDAASRQGIARIAVAYAPGLRVGAFANARIAAGEATQPVLPQSAVMVDGQGSFVYVVAADGKVTRRNVRVGPIGVAGLSIVDGLSGTEKVVRSAGAFLAVGETVKPVTVAAGAN